MRNLLVTILTVFSVFSVSAQNESLIGLYDAPIGYKYVVTLTGSTSETLFEKYSGGSTGAQTYRRSETSTDTRSEGLVFRLTKNGSNISVLAPITNLTIRSTGYHFSSASVSYSAPTGSLASSSVKTVFERYRGIDLNGNFWYVINPLTSATKLRVRSENYDAYIDFDFTDHSYQRFAALNWTQASWTYAAKTHGLIPKRTIPGATTLIDGINAAIKADGFGVPFTNIGPAVTYTTIQDLIDLPVGHTLEFALPQESKKGTWKKQDGNVWSPVSGQTNGVTIKIHDNGNETLTMTVGFAEITNPPAGGNPFLPKPFIYTFDKDQAYFPAVSAIGNLYGAVATRDSKGGLWLVDVGNGTSTYRYQLRSPNYNTNVAILFPDGGADFINENWSQLDWYVPGPFKDCCWGTIQKSTVVKFGAGPTPTDAINFFIEGAAAPPGPVFK